MNLLRHHPLRKEYAIALRREARIHSLGCVCRIRYKLETILIRFPLHCHLSLYDTRRELFVCVAEFIRASDVTPLHDEGNHCGHRGTLWNAQGAHNIVVVQNWELGEAPRDRRTVWSHLHAVPRNRHGPKYIVCRYPGIVIADLMLGVSLTLENVHSYETKRSPVLIPVDSNIDPFHERVVASPE